MSIHRPEETPEPNPETTYYLEDEGISDGDDLGGWISDYIDDNVEIIIPPGDYDWSTRAFSRGHPTGYGNTIVRGQGEFGDVVAHHGDGYGFSEVMAAHGGDLLVDNIIWRGETGGNGNITLRAGSDDMVTIRRLGRPDGSHDDGEGIYVRYEHAGIANVQHCWFENFTDNGLYASGPGRSTGNDGEVNVYGGLYRNNNISNIRIGSSNSTVEKATVVVDQQRSDVWGSDRVVNMRGIWVREGTSSNGQNITITDCDVWNELSWAPVEMNPRDNGGSGEITDCRIYNESNDAAIRHRGGSWGGGNNHATGPGSLTVEIGSNNCEGDWCNTAYNEAVYPVGERDAEGVILAPSGVLPSSSGRTSIEVSWTHDGANVERYNVYLDGDQYGSTTYTRLPIEELHPGRVYEIGVAAENADGEESSVTSMRATTIADTVVIDDFEESTLDRYNGDTDSFGIDNSASRRGDQALERVDSGTDNAWIAGNETAGGE